MVSTVPTDFLTGDDDPELWAVVLDTVLLELEPKPGMAVEVGRCSHWLRPHQCWWIADGSFACPIGYGGGGRPPLPQFDWSVSLRWTGEVWEPTKRQSVRYSLRVTIPSRTTRHAQAAVHTLWMTGREKQVRFYGFRKRSGSWTCTAAS